MLRPRIIPCLLVKNGGLVKTVQFGSPKYVGDPINAVRIFNEKEVDELIVVDIDATVQNREPDYTLIKNLAAECRMPLCYGGGVKTVEQVEKHRQPRCREGRDQLGGGRTIRSCVSDAAEVVGEPERRRGHGREEESTAGTSCSVDAQREQADRPGPGGVRRGKCERWAPARSSSTPSTGTA